MGSKNTRRYSDEYKRDAIEVVRSSDRTVTEVARELGVSPESLRGWVKKSREVRSAEARQGADARDEELRRLRKLAAEQAKTIEILKKSDRLLREGERPVSEVRRFIHAEKANYTVVLLCRVMRTGRSTYYAWAAGREAREAGRRADEALAHVITVIHIASRGNYGVPRATAELRRQGHIVNHC
ncbi:transposase [Streptomyces sp. NRRL F-2664]|uniref:transposase n=1 Tax=Streptomyces sp. NRRL F-2664 TaxID=1463842 RepID=UPI000997B1C5|nr:transposase [Streptomyces sp. NRRL F-2664]